MVNYIREEREVGKSPQNTKGIQQGEAYKKTPTHCNNLPKRSSEQKNRLSTTKHKKNQKRKQENKQQDRTGQDKAEPALEGTKRIKITA